MCSIFQTDNVKFCNFTRFVIPQRKNISQCSFVNIVYFIMNKCACQCEIYTFYFVKNVPHLGECLPFGRMSPIWATVPIWGSVPNLLHPYTNTIQCTNMHIAIYIYIRKLTVEYHIYFSCTQILYSSRVIILADTTETYSPLQR